MKELGYSIAMRKRRQHSKQKERILKQGEALKSFHVGGIIQSFGPNIGRRGLGIPR